MLTPGDPTLAYGINFYFEDNYREAAEPWHEDEEYAAFNTSSFTLTMGSTSPPTCTATTFTAVTQPASTPVQYSFCSYITANTSASASVGSWSVVTSGILSVTTTYFTSFATADSVFYQIGTAITGTRTYISATGSNSTNTISSLQSPGGDGQNNNKLYNGSNPTPFDDGGWSYTVSSGTPVLPGVTASDTTTVRLYYSDSGYWTEQALPSFQNEAPASTASSFTYQLASLGTVQCPPSGAATGTGVAGSSTGTSLSSTFTGSGTGSSVSSTVTGPVGTGTSLSSTFTGSAGTTTGTGAATRGASGSMSSVLLAGAAAAVVALLL